MRIITTWMYFDASTIEPEGRYYRRRGRGDDVEPGIGIAWCAGDTTTLMQPISNLKAFRELPSQPESFDEAVLRRYLDAFLIDEEDFGFRMTVRSRILLSSIFC